MTMNRAFGLIVSKDRMRVMIPLVQHWLLKTEVRSPTRAATIIIGGTQASQGRKMANNSLNQSSKGTTRNVAKWSHRLG